MYVLPSLRSLALRVTLHLEKVFQKLTYNLLIENAVKPRDFCCSTGFRH